MTYTSPQSRRLGWVVGLTSTAYFMVVLDALVVITALPRMQRDLHVGLSSLQWTVNAYGIAFAAGIITAAALGDRFGRRRVFNTGLPLFTLASAACALVPGASELIVARTVQGLGAAVVLPLSLTILTTAFPPEKRGMIVGVYGGLAGLAVALGPIVGGVITQTIDWHWIFWLNVPLGLAAVLLGTRLLPESHGAPERLDLAGVGLVTAGVVALVWALTRANQVGWASAEIVACLAGGTLLIALFVWWEHRTAEPMLPPALVSSRQFAIGNLTTYFLHGATFATAFFVTQDFQFARGYSPLGTGLRLLPFFATPMLVAPLAGPLGPDRPSPDHGHRDHTPGTRVHLGSRPRLAGDQLDRARRRRAPSRHRRLHGPPHGSSCSVRRSRPAPDGQGVRDQLHGPALRHRIRARDRKRGVRRERTPRQPRRGHRRLRARDVDLCLLRRPRRAVRHRDGPIAAARQVTRPVGRCASRRMNPTHKRQSSGCQATGHRNTPHTRRQ